MRLGAGKDPQDVFVGRSAELELLDAQLARVRAGDRRVVAIQGEPGVGKTALLEHFAASAVEHGNAVVIRACGEEEESVRAFEMVRQLHAAIDGDPSRVDIGVGPQVGADPYAVGADLAARLDAVADGVGARPAVVLALDDVHLCDEPSTAALLFALRRLMTRPLLCVVTARPGDAGNRWRRLASQRGRFLELDGLHSRDIARLADELGRPISHGVAERLHAHTAGNPLWVCNLLPGISAERLDVDAGDLVLPVHLASAVAARHASMSPPTRRLLSAAAVLGARFEVTLAAGVAGIDDPLEALEEARAADLIREVGSSPLRYRFAHPLLRAAIYQDLGPAARAALHRDAHDRTTGAGSMLHLAAAALGADEQVASQLEDAGTQALAAGEVTSAARLLGEAARLSEPGSGRGRRSLLAMEAWLVAGEPLRARAHLGLAERDGVDPLRGYVLGVLARSELRLDDARRHLEAVVAATDDLVGDAIGARAMVELALLEVVRMAPNDAMALANRALTALDRGHQLWHLARCVRAVGLGLAGEGEAGLAQLEHGPANVVELHELVGRGVVKLWTDDLEGAYLDLRTAHRRAAAGEPLQVLQPLTYLAETCYRMGKLSEAAQHAELACAITEAADRQWDTVAVHTRAGIIAAAVGNQAEAAAHADAIVALATRLAGGDAHADALRASVVAASGVSVALALAGQDPEALLVAAEAASRLNVYASEPGAWTFGPTLPEALIGVGRREEAARALEVFSDRAARLGRRSAQLQACRVAGLLASATGADDEAVDHFQRGLALAATLALPIEVGRLRLALGRTLARTGAVPRARQELMGALQLFSTAGAVAYQDQVVQALADLGLDAAAEARGRLTATEQAVAGLVAQHLSNPEIAERLSIARKTVEFHLSNIYGKLGLADRKELAVLAAGWRSADKPSEPGDEPARTPRS